MKTTSKKTARAKLVINWPTEAFTVNDLQKQYPHAVNITLRFRVNKAMENNEIVRVGHNTGSSGRPTLVFLRANPSKEMLARLKTNGVVLEDQYEKILSPSVHIKHEPKQEPKHESTVTHPATSLPSSIPATPPTVSKKAVRV